MLVYDPLGWISWIIANLIVSAFWYVPMGLGLLLGSATLMAIGTTVFVAMWMPPPIESVAVAFLTIFFYKVLKPIYQNGRGERKTIKGKDRGVG